MTRLTRLSAAAQAHYVVLRSVPEISLIPFDKNIEKLFQIFSDGSRAYNTDISAFAVFTDHAARKSGRSLTLCAAAQPPLQPLL